MGYYIELINEETNEQYELDEKNYEGSQFPINGNIKTNISITYNYAKYYYDIIDKEKGLRWIYGKKAKDCKDKLKKAIEILGIDKYRGVYHVVDTRVMFNDKLTYEEKTWLKKYNNIEDYDLEENKDILESGLKLNLLHDTGGYWKATSGNAGYMLTILYRWCELFPDGIFEGD